MFFQLKQTVIYFAFGQKDLIFYQQGLTRYILDLLVAGTAQWSNNVVSYAEFH